jgi:hypothetical protein
MRFLLIGDFHHQAIDRGNLLCSQAIPLWQKLITSKQPQPDAYFQVGDLIDGYKLADPDCREDMEEITAATRCCPVPFHPIIGNHETCWLPDRPFHLKALNLRTFSRVIDLGPMRMVLFDITVDRHSHGELTKERVKWLIEAVQAEPRKPTIILQHQLVHGEDEICNHRHYVLNSGEYRKLLDTLPQVVMLITGHRHLPTLTLLGARKIPQITLGAFCSYPFTVGELCIDTIKSNATFREVALETLFDPGIHAEFSSTVEHGYQLLMEHKKGLWGDRPRLTPDLKEVTLNLKFS